MAGFAGKRLPCVKLMDASILQEFNLQHHRYLRKMVQFIPYSFKELANLDLLEYSTLSQLNLLNYVTGIQRLCVADDVFWCSMFNTDADGEPLLVWGLNGATCVIGWHEIQVAFGALHDQRDKFRAIKIAHKQFTGYKPGDYLPETVETNVNKKLVSGQPYEEINYYKEAAPYGSTYYLMSVITELFWCNTRSPRFTSAQVYCYMRSLHGFKTNWAKALLHGLRIEILFLQKRARENNDKQQIIPVVWAPTFLQILYTYRQTIFAGSALSEAEGWLGWSHMSRDGDIDIHALVARFPTKIEDLREIREKCKRRQFVMRERTALSPTRHQRLELANDHARRRLPHRALHQCKKQLVPGLRLPVHSLRNELDKAKAEIADVWEARVGRLTLQLESADGTIADLKKDLTNLRQEVASSKLEGAKEAKAQVEAELQLQMRTRSRNGRSRLKVLSAEATSAKQQVASLQLELQTQTAAAVRYQTAWEAELQRVADLEMQAQQLNDEIDRYKHTADRAEKAQAAARLELAQVKKELRLLQLNK
ncbi:hypothetical protein R1sor_020006 [Riccia sorocarpa]|uniref:Uncharacterized protein n=1 Tax=Riccia sorocarpa TaxID=122646 RepID=A0ABD3IHG2_9MARC